MARQLKPKPVYGVDHLQDDQGIYNYEVQKYDPHMEHVLERYHLYKPPPGVTRSTTCDCFAGLMHKHCRHKQILDIFIAEGAVGSARAYCFDRKSWLE